MSSPHSLSALHSLTYPGRAILLGRGADQRHDFVAYAITGRSPSSQARRLVHDDTQEVVRTAVTDPHILQQGDPRLLLYPCLLRHQGLWLISNGAQSTVLQESAAMLEAELGETPQPFSVLQQALAQPRPITDKDGRTIDLTNYEPDAPNWTPRICGAIDATQAAFAVVRRDNGKAKRDYHMWALQAGHGAVISTYAGPNVAAGKALPSFEDAPLAVTLDFDDAQALAEAFYEALAPQDNAPDLRVAVMAMAIARETRHTTIHLINRHDRSAT